MSSSLELLPLCSPPLENDKTKWFYHSNAGGYRLQFGRYCGSKINELPLWYLWYCHDKKVHKNVCTSMPCVYLADSVGSILFALHWGTSMIVRKEIV